MDLCTLVCRSPDDSSSG